MIYLLTKRAYDHTVRRELIDDPSLRQRLKLLSYEKLFRKRWLRGGTYIFGDLERLDHEETEKAAIAWQAIHRHLGGRTVNDPIRSMRRFELLRTLHAQGKNSFNAYRLADPFEPKRYPVFIRAEDDHGGAVTPLLHSAEELAAATERLAQDGQRRENKIVIEFCDVSDSDGIFHKYDAFRVGSQIIPGGFNFSRDWMVKDPAISLKDEEFRAPKAEYRETNPHADALLQIFKMASIEYGRIDYAILENQIQVFEINTNPWSLAADRLSPALVSLDTQSQARIPVRIPGRLLKPTPGAILEQRRLRLRSALTRLHIRGLRTRLTEAVRRRWNQLSPSHENQGEP